MHYVIVTKSRTLTLNSGRGGVRVKAVGTPGRGLLLLRILRTAALPPACGNGFGDIPVKVMGSSHTFIRTLRQNAPRRQKSGHFWEKYHKNAKWPLFQNPTIGL